MKYLNPECDFEIINGKKCLKDGKVLRVHQTMIDSANTKPVWISDGSGSPLSLCRPGYRMHTAIDRRAAIAEEKELDRFATSIYDAYDAEMSQAWRTPAPVVGPAVANDAAGTWSKEAWTNPSLQKGEEEEADDEEGDDYLAAAVHEGAVQEAFNQTRTHTESQQRRRVPDRLQRDHEARMRQLKPQLSEWATFNDRLAEQQKIREEIMDAEYGKYDAAMREAWRK